MKKILLMIILLPTISFADCSEIQATQVNDLHYNVDKMLPNYLKGAKITVVLADGSTSTVPAEKFMVVPRKQQIIIGKSENITKRIMCKNSNKKNIIIGEIRKDITDLDVSSDGKQAHIESIKEITPGVNYYRRELFDSSIGAGVGVDTNGVVKGMVGIDF